MPKKMCKKGEKWSEEIERCIPEETSVISPYVLTKMLIRTDLWVRKKTGFRPASYPSEVDAKAQGEYVRELDEVLFNIDTAFPNDVFKMLEDRNYHTLNEYLVREGMFEDMSEFEGEEPWRYRPWLREHGDLKEFYQEHRPGFYKNGKRAHREKRRGRR